MANEYLKRTNTSNGNDRTFTYAFWIKGIDITASNQSRPIYNFDGGSNLFQFFLEKSTNNNPGYWVLDAGGSYSVDIRWKGSRIDPSAWYHITFLCNTAETKIDFADRGPSLGRVNLYINGVEIIPDGSQNSNLNSPGSADWPPYNIGLYHGANYINGIAGNSKYQLCDYYFVDGQALTPDVFGFYKDGDGYMSSAMSSETTIVTDFRPGQWMPHAPSKIKKDINRRGGFGVNGFYLPMNDSSNPGADFHCAPNSIIKLKGEDLPQPRNGAPTTSDAFVSQLRQETGTLGFDGVVKFDGDGDYLSIADHDDLDLGTGDFTIEFFAYAKTSALHDGYVGKRNPSSFNNNSWRIAYHNTYDNINLLHADSGGDFTAAAAPAPGSNWTHYAFTRQSGTLRVFRNGVKTSEASGWTYDFSNSYNFLIGANITSNYFLDGFLSNVRVIKGTALYTANFTAPSAPLTNVTNTKLLCCNSSTSATAATVTPGTITANGDVFATRNELTGSIVLAVPGISTSTSATLITNGTFDTNINGWTTVQATTSWQLGTLRIIPNSSVNGAVYQSITTEIGKRYTVTMEVVAAGALQARIHIGTSTDIDSADKYTYTSGNYNSLGVGSIAFSFTPTTTTTVVWLEVGGGTQTQVDFDNVSVTQENVPLDYSADIKGSGTNKTLTANGNAGVGYDLGGYYGSAMTFDGNGDFLSIPNNSDFNYSDGGDFTIELWWYRQVTNTNEALIGVFENSSNQRAWQLEARANAGLRFEWWSNGSSGTNISTANDSVPAGQWHHICAERNGNNITLYVNGVAVGANVSAGSIHNNTTDPLRIGNLNAAGDQDLTAKLQDIRVYKGLAKYKGGFDVPKPYTPVGIEAFRTTTDTCKNNFATLNPAILSNPGLTDGNLKTVAGSSWRGWVSTFSFTSGKYYMEMHFPDTTTGGSYYNGIGLKHDGFLSNSSGEYFGDAVGKAVALVRSNGIALYNNGNQGDIATGTYTGSHTMGMAIDADSGKVWWSMDGTWIGANPSTGSNASYTFTAGQTVIPGVTSFNSSVTGDLLTLNFGQNPTFSGQVTAGTNADGNGKGLFKYAPPTGFLALCTDNLPSPAIADPGDYMKTVLWTGDGNGGRSITGVGFQPDFVWVKRRNAAAIHFLFDSVRGAGKYLQSSATAAEGNDATNTLMSFDSNGFTSGNTAGMNGSTHQYVAWCWKAGGAAVSNTDGSITSQVSVNQTAGFSIVSYTGTGANATVGHGLGKTPKLIIVKNRDSVTEWPVLETMVNGGTHYLRLDGNYGSTITSVVWNNTNPTSDVFSVGTYNYANENNSGHIAYCWTEIEGYSKFGSYAGNQNADGSFVYCGFKPAWVLIKSTTLNPSAWILVDSSRDPVNPCTNKLFPDYSGEENVSSPSGATASTNHIDLLSNGFKMRSNNSWTNYSSNTYVFMAFAESPFKTANAK